MNRAEKRILQALDEISVLQDGPGGLVEVERAVLKGEGERILSLGPKDPDAKEALLMSRRRIEEALADAPEERWHYAAEAWREAAGRLEASGPGALMNEDIRQSVRKMVDAAQGENRNESNEDMRDAVERIAEDWEEEA